MLRIPCPWCGLRDEREFDYGGTHTEFPAIGQASDALETNWNEAIHLRNNPQAQIRELWYHRSGCERWISVVRNTLTHEFQYDTKSDRSEASGNNDAD